MLIVHRFYVPQQLFAAERVALPSEVARQVTRVLRLRPGHRIVLFGGDGFEVEAVLEEVTGRDVVVVLGERRRPEVELTRPLHLAVAALKGEKLDWVIQKVTEVGAASISLLLTERTISQAGEERWSKRLERFQRIAREAVEQCGGVRLPEIREPRRLREVLAEGEPGLTQLILDPLAEVPLATAAVAAAGGVRLLIGPEGGFTPEEIGLARELGAVPARLGRRVLRAETAAVAAAAVVGTAQE